MDSKLENIEQKQEEFLALYEDSRESLVRFAKSMTKNVDDAKDLVQDTILSAFEKFETLKNKQAFKSFLFTIASRIHKRKIWRKRLFANFLDEENREFIFDNLVSNESSPEDIADISVLNRALDSMSLKYKEAVILFEIVGLSMEEISKIQGVSVSGVKSRVQRARKQLEEILVKERNIYKIDDYPNSSPIKISKYNSNYNEFYSDLKYYKTEVLP